jgi:hypothetical protein
MWQGYFCVADAGNNRVMVWRQIPSENAAACDLVLGQRDFENCEHNCSSYWPLSSSLNMPYGLTASGKWILAADTANSRVLGWSIDDIASGARAGALLGQRNLHEKGDNRWGDIAADSICWPYSLSASGEHLIICDSGNNRVSLWSLTL